ncbi:MAG: hypothetical protein IJ345_06375 [Clostridia bacterium]|nr:hypothetical protein [Clostridia bacterium]
MDFKEYFVLHAKKHPSLLPQDAVKFCYQAALGAEHLLVDIEAARRYFDAEFERVEERQGDLVEFLTDELCRVDLGVWKARGLPREALFDAFAESAGVKVGDKERLRVYLDDAEACFGGLELNFSLDEWRSFLERYAEAGMPAVHHSDAYRESEKPSYRVIRREALDKFI